jgi:hypothetical protein
MEKVKYPQSDREWRSTTGMDANRFSNLLQLFESAYVVEFGRRIEYRVADSSEQLTFRTCK